MPFTAQNFTDHLARNIYLPRPAKRVVSLVPSLSELILELGDSLILVGRTSFCIHPKDQIKQVAKIGGTKNPKIDRIRRLQPDLIIANKEENRKEDIDILAGFAPVWVSDIAKISRLLESIIQLGTMLNSSAKASIIHHRLTQLFVARHIANKIKVVYLIWKDPFMTVGGDTYINEMISLCGFENIFKNQSRYPTLTTEDIRNSDADLILLSSEPYPFKKSHEKDLSSLFGNIPCRQVNGEIFSWYGSRLIHLEPEWNQLKLLASGRN